MAKLGNSVHNPRPAPRPMPPPKGDGRILEDLSAREAELARREAELAAREAKLLNGNGVRIKVVADQGKYQGGFNINFGNGGRDRFMYLTEAEWVAANIQDIRNAFNK